VIRSEASVQACTHRARCQLFGGDQRLPASDPVDKAIYHAVMSEWPGVFISSTCYDLIDLRAELEAMLRDLGLHPVLSDRPTSEFDTSGSLGVHGKHATR
jgi:hypothetical protein